MGQTLPEAETTTAATRELSVLQLEVASLRALFHQEAERSSALAADLVRVQREAEESLRSLADPAVAAARAEQDGALRRVAELEQEVRSLRAELESNQRVMRNVLDLYDRMRDRLAQIESGVPPQAEGPVDRAPAQWAQSSDASALAETLQQVLSSRSWRVTRPLRWVSGVARFRRSGS